MSFGDMFFTCREKNMLSQGWLGGFGDDVAKRKKCFEERGRGVYMGVQSTWATVEVNEYAGRLKSGWER